MGSELAELSRALPSGALHAADGLGRAPLLVCCQLGHLNMARLLLELGAGVSSRDRDQRSAVHLAAAAVLQRSSAEEAEALLPALSAVVAAGARARLEQTRERNGRTPLLAAARLLPGPTTAHGGGSAPDAAAAWQPSRAAGSVGARVIGRLLSAGCDPFARDASDRGLFDYAAAAGDLATVRLVLVHPACRASMGLDAARPGAFLAVLFRAVRAGDDDLIGSILSREPTLAAAHEPDTASSDPTRAAAGGGGLRRRTMLGQSEALLQRAPRFGDERPVLPDLTAGAGSLDSVPSVLSVPAADARAAASAGVPPSSHPMARTAAATTAAGAEPAFLRWSDDDAGGAAGGEGDADDAGGQRRTALMLASGAGRSSTAALLLEWGAVVNAQDARGGTALHHAVRSGAEEVAAVLLAAGADTSTRDAWGRTALEVLARGESGTPLWSAIGDELMDRAGPTDIGLGPAGGDRAGGAGLSVSLLTSAVRAMGEGRGDAALAAGVALAAARPDAAAAAAESRYAASLVGAEAAEGEEAQREADTEEARRRWARQGAERAARGMFSLFRSTWRSAGGSTGPKRKGKRTAALSDGASYVEPPKGTAFSASRSAAPPSGTVASARQGAPAAETGGAYAADPIDEERLALRAWAARPRQTPGEALAGTLPPRPLLRRFVASMRAAVLAAGASAWCSAALSEAGFPPSIVGLIAAGADRALLPLPGWVRAGLNDRWAFRDTALPDIPGLFSAGGGAAARGGAAPAMASAALRASAQASAGMLAAGAGGATSGDALGLGGLAALVQWIRSRSWPAERAPAGPEVDGATGLAAMFHLQRRAEAATLVPGSLAGGGAPSVEDLQRLSAAGSQAEWAWDVFGRCPRLALGLLSSDHACVRSLGQLRALAASRAGRRHIGTSLQRARVPAWAAAGLRHHLEADAHARRALSLLSGAAMGPDSAGEPLPQPSVAADGAGVAAALGGATPRDDQPRRKPPAHLRRDELDSLERARALFGRLEPPRARRPRGAVRQRSNAPAPRGAADPLPASYVPGRNGTAVPARSLLPPLGVRGATWGELPSRYETRGRAAASSVGSVAADDGRPSQRGSWEDGYGGVDGRRVFGDDIGSRDLGASQSLASVQSPAAEDEELLSGPGVRGSVVSLLTLPSPTAADVARHRQDGKAAFGMPWPDEYVSMPSVRSSGGGSEASGTSTWHGAAGVRLTNSLRVPGRDIMTPRASSGRRRSPRRG